MPKWDSGTNDCAEQDLIMQAGKARQARHVRRMRSRLQGARSRAVVDSKETFRCPRCTVHCANSWRTHCAGLRQRKIPKQDPVEALSNGGDCCGTSRVGLFKAGGSTGGRPWFSVRSGMHLALAVCGAICTG
jgi:hypothetical protein